MAYKPALWALNRMKGVLREFLPPHIRFVRSGSRFLAHGEPEVHELPRLVEPGTVAVDVGANIGWYAFALCRAVGPEGHVLCVEPLENLARLLRAAADRLGLPMTVVNCALSFQPGTADLHVPWVIGQRWHAFASLEHAGDGGETHRVELRRLDDVVAGVGRRISFIKIDAEGHELAILRGSVATLRQHHPNLLVEIEQRHSPVPVQETIDYIRSQGYEGYFLDASGSRRPLGQFDVSRDQEAWLGHDQKAWLKNIESKNYINNFIFIPG
jgi:FkbM family methyltransferase